MADPSAQKPYAESVADLRALANRWVLLARDHARESKAQTDAGDDARAAYYRGMAEACHKLALELANVVKAMPAVAQAAAAPEDETTPPETRYAAVTLQEALRTLDYAGVGARDVKQHKDNVFSAVFSRWQPFSETERLDRIRNVDPRIVIVAHGKLPDTHDPYVDFAFSKE